MTLYSLKVYGTQNTGDAACNPLDYYGHPYTPLNIIDAPRPRLTAKDTVVIGGGGLLAHSPAWDATIAYFLASPAAAVIWGAGHNTHYDCRPFPPLPATGPTTALRDCLPNRPCIPCPSCKSPVFDDYAAIAPNQLIGVISHRDHLLTAFAEINDFPHIENTAPLREILSFIAGHRYILANTYHGLYWSWLLGRTPIIAVPFSTRFDHLPFPAPRLPVLSLIELRAIMESWDYTDPGALTRARSLNDHFHTLVRHLL